MVIRSVLIKKDFKFICQERWTKKKSVSEFSVRNPGLPTASRMLYQLSYGELAGDQDHILGSYETSVLYTSRISNVQSVLCGDSEKDG